MVGVLAVGFVANLMIRPVAERFHEPEAEAEAGADRGGEVSRVSIKLRLVLGWALVGIPLAYGIYQTVVKAASLSRLRSDHRAPAAGRYGAWSAQPGGGVAVDGRRPG